MRLLLFIFLLPLFATAQNGFTAYTVNSEFKILVNWPSDTSGSKKFATLFAQGGNGEVGTNTAVMFNVGVGRQFTLPTASLMPDSIIYVLILPTNALFAEQPNRLYTVFDYFMSKTQHSDTTNWMMYGLSQGAVNIIDVQGWNGDAGLAGFGTGANYRMNRVKKFVAASMCNTRDQTIFSRFSGKGVRMFSGSVDATCNPVFTTNTYNSIISAGGYGTNTVVAGGGHDNGVWDISTSPTGTDTTSNIYLWLLAGNQGNITPTADAGSNQTLLLPTNTGVLDGRGSADADGTITGYLWTKVSGGPATITSPTSSNTFATGLTAGSYVFNLQVTDNVGATANATVNITVKANGTKYHLTQSSGSLLITKNSTTPPLSGLDTVDVPANSIYSNVDIQDIQGTGILVDLSNARINNSIFTQSYWYDLQGVTIFGGRWLNFNGTIHVERNFKNSKIKDCVFRNSGTYRSQPILQFDKPFSTDNVFNGDKETTMYSDTLERNTFDGFQDITPIVIGTNWNSSNNEINRSIALDWVIRYDTMRNFTNTSTSSGFQGISGTGQNLQYYGNVHEYFATNVGAAQRQHIAEVLWYGTIDYHDNTSYKGYAQALRNITLRWTGLPSYSGTYTKIYNNRVKNRLSYSAFEVGTQGAGNRNTANGFFPARAEVIHNTVDSTVADTYNPNGGNQKYHGTIVDAVTFDTLIVKDNVGFRLEMDYPATTVDPVAAIGAPVLHLTKSNNYTARFSTGSVVDSTNYKPSAGSPLIGGGGSYSYYDADFFKVPGNTDKGYAKYVAGVSVPSCATNTSPSNGSTVAAQTTATLTWGAVSGATSYDVYINGSLVANRTVTNYTATGLVASNNYTWFITPRNAAGPAVGCVANSTSFTTAGIPVPGCATNLSPVDGSTVLGQTTASLSWTAVSGATSYNVYFGAVFVTNATTNSFNAATLAPATTYNWSVRPCNSSGCAVSCTATTFTTAGVVPWKTLDVKRKRIP